MKRLQKILSVLLTVCFCLTTVSLTAAAADTSKAGDVAVGDTFYFGHYPQSRVDDRALIARLNAQGAPVGSVVTLGDLARRGECEMECARAMQSIASNVDIR